MKKGLLFILAIIILLSLSSCAKNENLKEKIYISDCEYKGIISYDDIKNFYKNESSFRDYYVYAFSSVLKANKEQVYDVYEFVLKIDNNSNFYIDSATNENRINPPDDRDLESENAVFSENSFAQIMPFDVQPHKKSSSDYTMLVPKGEDIKPVYFLYYGGQSNEQSHYQKYELDTQIIKNSKKA